MLIISLSNHLWGVRCEGVDMSKEEKSKAAKPDDKKKQSVKTPVRRTKAAESKEPKGEPIEEKKKRPARKAAKVTKAKKVTKGSEATAEITFSAETPFGVSSAVPNQEVIVTEPLAEPALSGEELTALESMTPLERKLADPVLPVLERENRARLQMQSPTRLYFYWSVRENPYKTLTRAFGNVIDNYTLTAKLVNHTRGTEELFAVEPEGNWWFNVDPDCLYRAEIGFYAPNRPYIRIIFSNFLRTPRRSPSWRTDYVPRFTVTADQFSEVLGASGYEKDAFEVALAGDDRETADMATRAAVNRLLGRFAPEFESFDGDDLRFVLLALASGYSLEELREHISTSLFEKLMASGIRVSPEQALAALKEHFDIEADEVTEIEETGPAVFGASAVHFPKRVRSRTVPRKLINRLAGPGAVSSSS